MLNASLKAALLSFVDLSEADLRGADLTDADFTGAEIWRTNLKGCKVKPGILHKMLSCQLP